MHCAGHSEARSLIRVHLPIPGGLTGHARTTRYWDCNKPSCGWPGKGPVTSPATSCNKAGLPSPEINQDSTSVLNGGPAHTCNMYAPWALHDKMSYGFAAFESGFGEHRTCCSCFKLTFKGELTGKAMIVQAINTGTDITPGGQFDIQIPGGGIGLHDGCRTQWNADSSWGQQYGGVWDVSACSNLPSVMQPGCRCDQQCCRFSRNSAQVTPKNSYFYYQKKYLLGQSIQK